MQRSYTGTLPAFTGAVPGRCRSSAGVCLGPGGAKVPSRLFPVQSRLFPVPRRSLPVLPGDSRFIPEVSVILSGYAHNPIPKQIFVVHYTGLQRANEEAH
ncbi:hypothetical protein DPMN_169349 [Dreissena polymorpha]|uniref:Uncharacterized protein n=1 Tax=Dreissena polymorpha TaxID=45954 RepID=A0A9D4DXQ8_DREPO|nr:hypothetical protein DPMN_169349 [Dreissena polymorpha]